MSATPDTAPVALELAVVHARSAGYPTRVVVPVKLRPGKNEVRIATDEMTNANGSAPDLAHIVRWFILDADNKGPTVYFGDVWLNGRYLRKLSTADFIARLRGHLLSDEYLGAIHELVRERVFGITSRAALHEPLDRLLAHSN